METIVITIIRQKSQYELTYLVHCDSIHRMVPYKYATYIRPTAHGIWYELHESEVKKASKHIDFTRVLRVI